MMEILLISSLISKDIACVHSVVLPVNSDNPQVSLLSPSDFQGLSLKAVLWHMVMLMSRSLRSAGAPCFLVPHLVCWEVVRRDYWSGE